MSSICTLHFRLVCGLLLERPWASINLTMSKSDLLLDVVSGISVASLTCLLGVNPLPWADLTLPQDLLNCLVFWIELGLLSALHSVA